METGLNFEHLFGFYRLTLVSKPVNKRLGIVVLLGVTNKSNNS